jgi:hypothetical protein
MSVVRTSVKNVLHESTKKGIHTRKKRYLPSKKEMADRFRGKVISMLPDVKKMMMMTPNTLVTCIWVLFGTDARFIWTSSWRDVRQTVPQATGCEANRASSHGMQTMMISDHWNRQNMNSR